MRAVIFAILCLLGAASTQTVLASDAVPAHAPLRPTKVLHIRMSDGVVLAAALYLPATTGRFPALLASSPYRFDNDALPATPVYLYKETGPIEWYVAHGYAYVRLDVRGTGQSQGEYRDESQREQRDLYEVIEWLARQPWSTGKVGGIGQSYYAREQWAMAVESPPHLACVAPYDGNIDGYRAGAYSGGVRGSNYPARWYDQLRFINRDPAAGTSRDLSDWDYATEVVRHPLYDGFWLERSVAERLGSVKIPVFSIGVWGKADLHLNGNIVGFQRVSGPKKLLLIRGGISDAVLDYASPTFHERYLKPFYDWCLKGEDTSYSAEPVVRYDLGNSDARHIAASWPPTGTVNHTLFLDSHPTRSVTSLNDGSLDDASPSAGMAPTVYSFPVDGWQTGDVGPGPDGRPDPARRVLTFTTAPLDHDVTVAGPIELVLWISSSSTDADLFVKISDQATMSASDRDKGINPKSVIVTKGWLRASHRKIDPQWSLPNAPWFTHDKEDALIPGQPTELHIAVVPVAYLFRKASRIRLELSTGDSTLTDGIFSHNYAPRAVGQIAILHDAAHPSRLILPVEIQP